MMFMFHQPIISLLFLQFIGVHSATFTLVNKCNYTVWPATLSGAGISRLPPSATGFPLVPGNSTAISIPASWSGRVWARTLCTAGQGEGNFTCATGDCGTGTVQCSGSGAAPPATLAEFTLDGAGGLDFYDVSLVDGYNLPLLIQPVGGSGAGNCTAAGCVVDLNGSCPAQLRVVSKAQLVAGEEGVACKSACDAFGAPQFCCSGAYSTPEMCKPSSYSEYFKNACPSAYSYAYDDATSTFTCQGADYIITFCPTATATDKSNGTQLPEATPISPDYYYDYLNNSSSSLIPLSPTAIIGLIMMIIWASIQQL